VSTPEGRIKAQVKRELQIRGIWFCMPATGGFGVSGVPDVLGCWHGRFIGIECKAPGKRANTTENQKARLAEIEAAGGLAVVVDDVAQLRAALDVFKKRWEMNTSEEPVHTTNMSEAADA
jgi:hypothetical protein